MAVSNLKLASIILGIGGVATGTGAGIYSYLNKPTQENKKIIPAEPKDISKWLSEDNAVLLKDDADAEEWKTNWGKFVDANTGDTLDEAWTFADYSSKKGDKNSVPPAFKEKCKVNSQLIIKNKGDGEYNNVKKYCSKEIQ